MKTININFILASRTVTRSHYHKLRDLLQGDYHVMQSQNLNYSFPLTVGMLITIGYDKAERDNVVVRCTDTNFTCTGE